MSDEKEVKLKIGEHEINQDHHPHAYAAIKGMSETMREQLFHNAHNSGHGGIFNVHINGKNFEYRLSKNGEIHQAHHN